MRGHAGEPLWGQDQGRGGGYELNVSRDFYLLWVCVDRMSAPDQQFTSQEEHSKQHSSPRGFWELDTAA